MKPINETKIETAYKCDHCDYKSTWQPDTVRHEKQVHTCQHTKLRRDLSHNSNEYSDNREFTLTLSCSDCGHQIKELEIYLHDDEEQQVYQVLEDLFEGILEARK